MTPEPFLRVCELRKVYGRRSAWLSRRAEVIALAGVSLNLKRGETLAVVGRSGSGKSTLAYCLAGYTEPTSGEIHLGRRRILSGQHDSRVQLVFQDSPEALNPRWTGLNVLDEPLRLQRFGNRAARRDRAFELANRVGLPHSCLNRRSAQLSGGERQRLAIARAFAVEPLDLLILDEPLRGLDAAATDLFLQLLEAIQKPGGPAMIYISHDLAVVRRLASRVMVLDHGQIAESGWTDRVLTTPQHPAAQALVQAILPET